MRKEKQVKIIALGMIAVIILLTSVRIGDFDQISVLNDEFGYWSIGAYLAGKDWSSLASQAPYYSYGYSIFLAPLFFLFKDPGSMYKAALVINIVMLLGIFGLSYRLSRRLFQEADKRIHLFLAFAVTLYSSNIVQAHVAWTETILCFLFWLIVNVAYEVIKKPGILKCGVLALLSIYTYMIHQRALGILASVILLVLILKLGKHINWKSLFAFFTVLALGVVIQSLFKSNVIDSVFGMFENSQFAANNDYSGQVGKFVLLFSKDGIMYFLQSFCGKAYYLGISTFLFVYWGCAATVRDTFISIKNWTRKIQKPSKDEIFSFFVFCSFAATFMITVVFTLVPGRVDTLLYGRYNEFSIGAVLLIGIIRFWKSKYRMQGQGIAFICVTLFAVVVNSVFLEMGNSSFATINAIGVSGFFENNVNPNNSVYASIVYLGIVSIVILFLMAHNKKRNLKLCSLLFVTGNWIVTGQNVVNELLVTIQKEQKENVGILAESMVHAQIENDIYYIKSDDTKDVNAEYFQYLLPDIKIHSIKFENLDEIEMKEEDCLLFLSNDKNIKKMMGSFRIIGQTQEYVLMAKMGSEIEDRSDKDYHALKIDPLKCESENVDQSIENELISNGNIGKIVKDKKFPLSSGTYEVTIEMQLHYADKNNLGYIQISRSGNLENIVKEKIKGTEFDEDKNLKKTITFSCNNSYSDVKLNVQTEKNVRLKVLGITCKRISNQYEVGKDGRKELSAYGEIVNDPNMDLKLYYYTEAKEAQQNLDMSYLEELFKQDKVTCVDREELVKLTEKNVCILMEKPAEIFDIQDILKDYVILDKGKKYILLASNAGKIKEKRIASGNSIFSEKEFVKLNYFAKDKGSILQNNETFFLEKGSYQIMADFTVLKSVGEKIGKITAYYDDKILNTRNILKKDVKNGKAHLNFTIASFYDMGKVTISISDTSGTELLVDQVLISKISNHYYVDMEKGAIETKEKSGAIQKKFSEIAMSTGNYIARYTIEFLGKPKDRVLGQVFVTGKELETKPVEIKAEDVDEKSRCIVELPFSVGFDIITLEDLYSAPQFGLTTNSKCKVMSIEILTVD